MRTDGIWGFYPIVDRAADVDWLLGRGVRTLQIRIKDLTGPALEDELQHAIESASAMDAQLYVNDYWKAAIQLGARRIHLGQGDLAGADPHAIAAAGLELGVSTHDPAELDHGLTWNPTYVALGPVWETTLKKMPWAPQGTARVRQWRQRIQVPLVAIGGITLERAASALDAGADAIALVSDIQHADRSAANRRVDAWLELFSNR